MLGLSETYVRELRSNKKLRSPGRNKKLILMSSVKALLEERQKGKGNVVHEVRQEYQQPCDKPFRRESQSRPDSKPAPE